MHSTTACTVTYPLLDTQYVHVDVAKAIAEKATIAMLAILAIIEMATGNLCIVRRHTSTDRLKSLPSIHLPGTTLLSVAAELPE